MEKFSVLMSVYKNEKPKFLKEAIESISVNQTIVVSEIILVKDGVLTEELENTISDLQKDIACLKVYGYNKNRGLGYALNFGLDKCNYELVFRMDTDDIAHPNRFQKQLKQLRDQPEISIIGSTIQEFLNIPGDINQVRTVPISSKNINSKKHQRNPFNHMTVLFKKSIILEVGGYIDMPGYEDYYLWLRLLKEYKGMNIDEPLVYARIGNNMIKRRQGIEFLKNEIRFQNAILKNGLIGLFDYSINIIFRGGFRILPVFFLKILYTKLLRK